MEKNFWRMDDLSLFTVPYAYVDHCPYLADSLFLQRGIKMCFKGEMVRDDSPYRLIFCRVLKRDTGRFEEALGKLKDKMLLMGYRDYGSVCEELTRKISEWKKKM